MLLAPLIRINHPGLPPDKVMRDLGPRLDHPHRNRELR